MEVVTTQTGGLLTQVAVRPTYTTVLPAKKGVEMTKVIMILFLGGLRMATRGPAGLVWMVVTLKK